MNQHHEHDPDFVRLCSGNGEPRLESPAQQLLFRWALEWNDGRPIPTWSYDEMLEHLQVSMNGIQARDGDEPFRQHRDILLVSMQGMGSVIMQIDGGSPVGRILVNQCIRKMREVDDFLPAKVWAEDTMVRFGIPL